MNNFSNKSINSQYFDKKIYNFLLLLVYPIINYNKIFYKMINKL